MERPTDLFNGLTSEETSTLLRMLRQGYAASRKASKDVRARWQRDGASRYSPDLKLISSAPGSLAGVRQELTGLCSDLVNHVRRLEMS